MLTSLAAFTTPIRIRRRDAIAASMRSSAESIVIAETGTPNNSLVGIMTRRSRQTTARPDLAAMRTAAIPDGRGDIRSRWLPEERRSERGVPERCVTTPHDSNARDSPALDVL